MYTFNQGGYSFPPKVKNVLSITTQREGRPHRRVKCHRDSRKWLPHQAWCHRHLLESLVCRRRERERERRSHQSVACHRDSRKWPPQQAWCHRHPLESLVCRRRERERERRSHQSVACHRDSRKWTPHQAWCHRHPLESLVCRRRADTYRYHWCKYSLDRPPVDLWCHCISCCSLCCFENHQHVNERTALNCKNGYSANVIPKLFPMGYTTDIYQQTHYDTICDFIAFNMACCHVCLCNIFRCLSHSVTGRMNTKGSHWIPMPSHIFTFDSRYGTRQDGCSFTWQHCQHCQS